MVATAASPTRRRGRGLVGVLMLLVAGVGVAYPLYWNHRSTTGGSTLLAQGIRAIGKGSTASCSSNLADDLVPHAGAPGVLAVPSLGLVAPVVNGVTDAVLNVAVGHPTVAPWPGAAGESLLEAHDVSYFASLDNIRTGATVQWITPCATATFVVTGTEVRSPGDFIATPPSGSGLALITCYPTNALFWTSQRWVVTTTLVSTTIAHQSLPATTSTGRGLIVPAPRSLVAQNLTLDANESLIRLATLQIAGSPALSWKEGPGPMKVEASALAAYFGAYKAITQNNKIWWRSLAPGVPMPASWPTFSFVTVTITVVGSTPTAVTLASSTATMHESVTNNVLRITSLS
jgi:LPXTG-site transpeptidase (sortase) family protein